MEFVYLAGILLSLLAAGFWAVHNLAVRIATAGTGVADAITVVMVTNVAIVAPAAVVFHYPDYGLSVPSTGAFIAAGVTGLLLGRICLFRGIRTVGASRTTPVVAASTLVSAVLAVWFLDETLPPARIVGIILIVGGIAIISWLMATDDGAAPSFREVGAALSFPLGAALFIGVEPIFVRFGLDAGTPVLVGLTVMSITALVGYLLYRRLRGDVIRIPAPGRVRRWYVVAGVASTLGLTTYFAALEAAPVVIVIPILQLSPLLVIVAAAIFLPESLERVTWKLGMAAVLVIIGATLVSLTG
ncbi:DMT family transporter [Halorubrum vacuolatum]|uniref:Uncharacterized membrane protein n=1 Tax=Halorubrum vacuolatum TaxID=63740 RepID=A0A238VAX0_HALVU|nr:EamA family transporter [Halorubrum vacuolatum]SNR31535.1 Uncharacterized membrane protein [Halorubrum vacuolatum]